MLAVTEGKTGVLAVADGRDLVYRQAVHNKVGYGIADTEGLEYTKLLGKVDINVTELNAAVSLESGYHILVGEVAVCIIVHHTSEYGEIFPRDGKACGQLVAAELNKVV